MKRNEKIFSVGAVLVLLFSVYAMVFEPAFLERRRHHVKGTSLGNIVTRQNDIRHRPADELAWHPAEDRQDVFAHEAVFAGPKSSVSLEMKDGQFLLVRENSMVVFENYQSSAFPNFEAGKFQLSVKGRIKVAIRGRITTFDGAQAKVELDVAEGSAPRIKVLDGRVTVGDDDHAVTFDAAGASEKKIPVAVFEKEAVPTPAPPRPLVLEAKLNKTEFEHAWTFDELYVLSNETVQLRTPPEKVDVTLPIHWNASDSVATALARIGTNHDPTAVAVIVRQGEPLIVRSKPGRNVISLSQDGKAWSAPVTFEVGTAFLGGRAPEVQLGVNFRTSRESAELSVALSGPGDAFVVEVSSDRDFASAVERRWVRAGRLKLPLASDGPWYVRARGVVGKTQLLSAWSDVREGRAVAAAPPKLKKKARETVAKVEPAPSKVAAREPQAVSEIVPAEPENVSWQALYDVDALHLGAALVNTQSSQQVLQGKPASHTTAVTFGVEKWFGAEGVEAKFWSTSPAATTSNDRAWDADVRYRHRFEIGRAWEMAAPLRLTPFVGVKLHGSESQLLFARHYEAATAGVQALLPLGPRFALEAEYGLGLGAGGSDLTFGMVQLRYYVRRDWALLLGYGATYFQARSRAFAPAGLLPYREGHDDYRLGFNYSF